MLRPRAMARSHYACIICGETADEMPVRCPACGAPRGRWRWVVTELSPPVAAPAASDEPEAATPSEDADTATGADAA